ncbi:MAG TPA: agmatinase family protein [Planctomycetota bacterium]|nr:agmatinase family protein [Planctomycetota bacterium]
MHTRFDPDAAAAPDSGIFGLSCTREASEVLLVPVPFDATTSYRRGAAQGPAAILAASRQVDLFDLQTGRPYERGICLLDADPEVARANERCAALARPIIAKGGATDDDRDALAAIEADMQAMNRSVQRAVAGILAEGKLPGVVGGDHSVPFGAIVAASERHPGLGILHVDAHADLRPAFEGFRYSHASIMANVLAEAPGVARIVQVGVRDFGEGELRAIEASGGRVVTHFDLHWQRRLAEGERLRDLIDEAIAALPGDVWVSFDIDGLDPALCRNTGTPVPGGLSFPAACLLLARLVESGRRIVGFDLDEVAPGPGGPGDQADEWDANVGARMLYKLCGFALLTR